MAPGKASEPFRERRLRQCCELASFDADPDPDPDPTSINWTSIHTNATLYCFVFHYISSLTKVSYFSIQYFGQHIEIFWEKVSLSLHLDEMDIDPDPDRLALNVNPDPEK